MRVFIASRAGDGTHANPWQPNLPIDVATNQLDLDGGTTLVRWMSWKVVHPDTAILLPFFIVLADNPANADTLNNPVTGWETVYGAADLGDPLDQVSLRQTKLGDAATDEIADLLGIPQNRLRNMSGAQVIKAVVPEANLTGARFKGGSFVDLFDETD